SRTPRSHPSRSYRRAGSDAWPAPVPPSPRRAPPTAGGSREPGGAGGRAARPGSHQRSSSRALHRVASKSCIPRRVAARKDVGGETARGEFLRGAFGPGPLRAVEHHRGGGIEPIAATLGEDERERNVPRPREHPRAHLIVLPHVDEGSTRERLIGMLLINIVDARCRWGRCRWERWRGRGTDARRLIPGARGAGPDRHGRPSGAELVEND